MAMSSKKWWMDYSKMWGFNNSKKIKLVTHNGAFHSDDIFACATLALVLEKEGKKFEVIRTRDKDIMKSGDYVFDIGGEYSPEKNIFDHHQVGGAGHRMVGNGDKPVAVEYASFGLVWKNFALKLVPDQKVADMIDRRLVAPIDAWDNGMSLTENKYDISPYIIQSVFGAMHPTWKEDKSSNDAMFLRCVVMAKTILEREIIGASDALEAEVKVLEAYQSALDKKIIVLDTNYPYEYALSTMSEPMFVVYPKDADQTWAAKAVRMDPKDFKNKKDFPVAWAGLRDADLQKASGVPDAVFCHRSLFLVVAKSKEGAIKLAQIALQS